MNKEKVQNLIAQQRINLAEVSYLDLNSINNIIKNLKNASDDLEFRKKSCTGRSIRWCRMARSRMNTFYLLANKKYTPTTIKELQDKALDWILRSGGIVQAAEKILKNQAPSDTAVAELARRFIINSDVFANDMLLEDRIKLNTLEIDERSRAGLTLRSMRLDSLNLKDVASVQALLNKLHKDMSPAEVRKLRDQIKKEHGIDIYKLDKSVVTLHPYTVYSS